MISVLSKTIVLTGTPFSLSYSSGTALIFFLTDDLVTKHDLVSNLWFSKMPSTSFTIPLVLDLLSRWNYCTRQVIII